MTYITPDETALAEEARHYQQQHPLAQGASRMRGRGFRGESVPMLTAAPIPPLLVKDYNPPVLGPIPGPNAITISPWDEAYRDDPRGPGTLEGLGELDPYRAGPCPICGEFAVGTFRHKGAPVMCRNGHQFRGTCGHPKCANTPLIRPGISGLPESDPLAGVGDYSTWLGAGGIAVAGIALLLFLRRR